MAELNLEQIKKIIPHREPFLLIDRVVELEPGIRVVAFKKLVGTEPWFAGHFPNYAVQPGVLTIEMMAQAGAVCVLSLKQNEGKTALFGGIDKARFKKPVFPGNELKLVVNIENSKGSIGLAKGRAFVDGELVASAQLITIVKQI